MKVYPQEKTRNAALMRHTGSGKTTLAETLLYRWGTIDRQRAVELGTAVFGHKEERSRGMSMSRTVAPLEWKSHKINLTDTPGYPDCVGKVHAACG